MPNENPNNDFHWKSKLEDLESLPGEKFNKDAAWDKLHMRMQGKRCNKKAVWYWAAAACLLFAILTPWFLSKNNENTLVKNNQEQQKIQSLPSGLVPTNREDSIAFIQTIPAENNSPVNFVENPKKIFIPASHKALAAENVAIKKDKEDFLEPVIIKEAAAPVDTQISIVIIVPEKKKLRVVHINELGEPVEEMPVMTARKTESHSFRLKLANQEVFVNPSGAYRKTGFTILSSKNSPN